MSPTAFPRFPLRRSALLPMFAALALLLVRGAPALEPGDIFKTLLGETLEGERIELAVLRDHRILIVEFWATWSPPSLEQHERLRELSGNLTGTTWVSVSLDRDRNVAREYFEAHPSNAIEVCDGQGFDGKWAQTFQVVTAPSIYVIDYDGIVRESLSEVGSNFTDLIARARRPPRPGTPEAAGLRESGRQLQRPDIAKLNQLAPDFTLRDIRNGEKLSLDDFDDHVVMIVLFASWNSSSTKYLWEIADIYEKAEPYGFELIAVSIETDEGPVRDWINDSTRRVRFPVAVQRPDDPISITFSKYPFDAELPWAFLIGKNGIIRDIGTITPGRLRQVLVEDLNFRL